jgi:hypothetical protein
VLTNTIRVDGAAKGRTYAPTLRDSRCPRVHPRGANAPRSCIAARTLADEKTIFAMHERTLGSRAAGVSPPWAWVTHLQRRFRKVAGDCRQCAHERRCSRVQRCRKGPTLVPAPTFRDFQSLSSRAGFPRGAYAPRSCIAARTLADEKTIFAMHKRTLAQERRASARRGSVVRSLCREKRMLFSDERTHDQERRA